MILVVVHFLTKHVKNVILQTTLRHRTRTRNFRTIKAVYSSRTVGYTNASVFFEILRGQIVMMIQVQNYFKGGRRTPILTNLQFFFRAPPR